MIELPISIKNRISLYTGKKQLVCGNSDYELVFTFDDEWSGETYKTAYIWYVAEDGSVGLHPILFQGERCRVPLVPDAVKILVGVRAGNLMTTTNAEILCQRTGLDSSTIQPAPPEDLYNQILAILNGMSGGSGGTGAIPKATKTTLGGVIVGDGLTVDETGKIAVDVAEELEPGSQKPISAGAVYEILGDLQTLLERI